MTIDVRLAETDADRRASWSIREQVFIGEQGIEEAIERDGLDELAWHFVAWEGDTPCGTARVLGVDDEHRLVSASGAAIVKIGRMAVLPAWRRRGIGRRLLDCAIDFARAHGARRAELSAQEYVVAFYEAAGFAVSGAAYVEAGIPHRHMTRTL
jgi:predicted GNAT family N-acyltransferase